MIATQTSRRFEQIYRELLVADIKRQLGDFFIADAPPEPDLAYALSVASRLALAADGEDLESASAARKAYNVATKTLGFGNGARDLFLEASEVILGRLGNFPARKLVQQRFDTDLSPLSALEILAREFENRVSITDSSRILTDFQVRLLKALESKRRVSVSAPTSAGKSFTLELEISRQLANESNYQVVYLVPTRALIRQVTFDLVQMVRGTEAQAVPILSVPSPPDEETSKVIYVLTQERFANLLAVADHKLKLNALIVDEAQEIAEENRGQTLEVVIGEALKRFPEAKVFFSSPLKSNPEYFLTLFAPHREAESFVEHVTPVSQNIINVYPIAGRGNTSRAQFDAWLEGEAVNVGVADLPFKFKRPDLHNFAVYLTAPNDTSIIYCNDPTGADRIATALAAELPDGTTPEQPILDLVDFLRAHIHPKYHLAEILKKRVAFHYGNVPQIIRGRIEELLRDRLVRFVCCTSTLLQGMNLPARNIFIENPKKGRGRPMSPSDFWNLVGRAGRMTKEFDGNVYCIHGIKWEAEPFNKPKLDSIRSAFTLALTDRVADVATVAVELPSSSESDLSWAEQVVARVYAEFSAKGREIARSEYANPTNRLALKGLDKALKAFGQRKILPDSIFETNLYFHPARLEQLADKFRTSNPQQWTPLNPYAPGSYQRLESCFRLLEDLFFQTGQQTYKYDAYLALQWMTGASLKDLILNKIQRSNAQEDVKRINKLIRELFDEIENRLRYKYVKYMKAYIDVLRAVFLEHGLKAESERIPPIHLYLEYGASSVTLISLISLGLSRTSAIILKRARRMRDDLTLRDCQQAIETIDVARSELPAICIAEISRLRRR